MFKKRDGDLEGEEPSFGSRVSAPMSSTLPPDAPEDETSVVGYSLEAEGKLITDKNLRVNGRVKGDIRAKAVTVGQHATVEGNIVSNEVVVSGTVIGEIRAVHVRLCNTAVVSGEIMHKLFAIESGAQFEGNVRHSTQPLDGDEPVPWNIDESGGIEDEDPGLQAPGGEAEAPAEEDTAW